MMNTDFSIRFAAARPTRFGQNSVVEQFNNTLDTLEKALSKSELKKIAGSSKNGAFNVSLGNRVFEVSGFLPNYGTAPQSFSLKDSNTGETIRYTEPGCFGVSSVSYKADANAKEFRLEVDAVSRVASLFYALRNLPG